MFDVKFVFRVTNWILLIQKLLRNFRAVFLFTSLITVAVTYTVLQYVAWTNYQRCVKKDTFVIMQLTETFFLICSPRDRTVRNFTSALP